MRVWLSRDPRVICMADRLSVNKEFMRWLTDPVQQSCKECAYEHVTRNVTVALCVTALLVIWGTAREQGDRENDDLVLKHCDLNVLDAMADLPGIGDAMEFVGWAKNRDDLCVVFPKFFKDQESPDDKHKRQNAERQARFREKNKKEIDNAEVTPLRNVTVTPREEKRREEKNKAAALPDWIPAESWNAWIKSRKNKPTPEAKRLAVMELEKLRADGNDPKAVLDQSTFRGWTGLFPVKDSGSAQKLEIV